MTAPPRPPVIAEPILGWRIWTLAMEPLGSHPLLLPAGMGRGLWPHRRAFEARCHARKERPKGHRPPTRGCSCGVYASDSLRSFMGTGRPSFATVIGQVSLWGKVIEHERGWRAKYAYPARLRLICGTCLQRGDGDGAPFIARVSPRGLVAVACREHRVRIPSGTSVDPDVVQAHLLSEYAVDLLPTEPLRSFFAWSQRPTVRFQLGWPETDVRPSSPQAPTTSDEAPPTATVADQEQPAPSARPHTPATSRPAVPTAASFAPSWSATPARPTPPRDPLLLTVVKGIGIGIAWILQGAFFLLVLFASCADAFHVVQVTP